MNKQCADLLQMILEEADFDRRCLAEKYGYGIDVVNESLEILIEDGYLEENLHPTEKAWTRYCSEIPKNAIILAAGFGMRMVPINLTTPKALLEVNGEPLIERMIKQLNQVGIKEITVVVGFMEERFTYLIDKYGVELIQNPDYARKNNLASLALAVDRISDTYIIPSDIWCVDNPFKAHEMSSWYMISDSEDTESDVRVNKRMELEINKDHTGGNTMIGIAYLRKDDAVSIRKKINNMAVSGLYDEEFWEAALYGDTKLILPANVVHALDVVEINTYEQLRSLDSESNHLKSDTLDLIAKVFGTSTENIVNISVLKKGMTNRSFLFSVNAEKYIMRIPGEGTDQLINRKEEAEVFKTISNLGLCDDPIYINPENGYKITKFLDDVRVCDCKSIDDLKRCMALLKHFHEMKLSVAHSFDIFGQIEFYESLWEGRPSMYEDYEQTKKNVFSLKQFVDCAEKDWCLTHIDAVPDNFLFYRPAGEDKEHLQLTDWEYSGMQDPHVDIAMFCIYSLYDKEETDRLIDLYFQNNCSKETRTKIYAYISMCGLLWSNWCEFKSSLGVEFGEYSFRQYCYAKEYYRYTVEMMGEQ